MKPDITEIRNDREINLLIEKGNEVLRELGYTEHSFCWFSAEFYE